MCTLFGGQAATSRLAGTKRTRLKIGLQKMRLTGTNAPRREPSSGRTTSTTCDRSSRPSNSSTAIRGDSSRLSIRGKGTVINHNSSTSSLTTGMVVVSSRTGGQICSLGIRGKIRTRVVTTTTTIRDLSSTTTRITTRVGAATSETQITHNLIHAI